MVSPGALGSSFAATVAEFGDKLRFRYFTISGANSGYDDNVTLTKSGADYYTSGVVHPIKTEQGSSEALLVEQGKLLNNDTALFVEGHVNTSGTWKVGIGSPPGVEYSLVPDGVQSWEVGGKIIYKKVFIRALPTGSIFGE